MLLLHWTTLSVCSYYPDPGLSKLVVSLLSEVSSRLFPDRYDPTTGTVYHRIGKRRTDEKGAAVENTGFVPTDRLRFSAPGVG